MQGLGKPGVHQASLLTGSGAPRGKVIPDISAAYRGDDEGKPGQYIYRTLLHEAILNPPVSWYSSNFHSPVQDQFNKYHYPLEGASEIHMIWSDDGCLTVCGNDGNKMIEALRSPKIEFIVTQHPWLEDDCLYSDIILPVNTKFEEDDISTGFSQQYDLIFPERKCIGRLN